MCTYMQWVTFDICVWSSSCFSDSYNHPSYIPIIMSSRRNFWVFRSIITYCRNTISVLLSTFFIFLFNNLPSPCSTLPLWLTLRLLEQLWASLVTTSNLAPLFFISCSIHLSGFFFFFFSFLNLFLFCRECHLYWLICLPNVNSLSVGIRMRMCLIICIFTFFLT